MRRRWSLAVLAWVLAAFLTTLVGVAAINSLGDGILGSADTPLTRQNVQTRLSATPTAAAQPSDDGTTSPTETQGPTSPETSAPPKTKTQTPTQAPADSHVLATPGGTIVAACAGGLVTLHSWSPAQGFQADHVVRGPASTASVRFRRDSGDDGHGLRVTVDCRTGQPQAVTTTSDD